MELEVADAAAALAELRATGREPDYPLTDEPFGQRRFSVKDPSGLWVNVVQQMAMPGAPEPFEHDLADGACRFRAGRGP